MSPEAYKANSSLESNDGAKKGVFYNWKLGENFCLIHFKHPLGHFGPVSAGTNVVQHRRMLVKRSAFYFFDKSDAV